MNKKLCVLILSALNVFGIENSEKVFSEIYENGWWGFNEEGKGFSGIGSTLHNNEVYISFIQDFVKKNKIKTIVDAGCGDWTFSKEVDWGDAEYLGLDVVKSVIDEDIRKYSSDKIKFKQFDLLTEPLPPADLLICKDVLMHLTNGDIQNFLTKIKNYKHCLFTHNIADVDQSNVNKEINRGWFRELDLTAPPFNLKGVKVLTYDTDHSVKQIVYYGNYTEGDSKGDL